MVIDKILRDKNIRFKEKAEKIKVILTDVDGVLTDTGIYYG
ncbi:MAG: 3-deoxy-D-manno-octulosonate 8-phosphate phosphatase, partial [Ignavibacterium sp.]